MLVAIWTLTNVSVVTNAALIPHYFWIVLKNPENLFNRKIRRFCIKLRLRVRHYDTMMDCLNFISKLT
jgi:hypothetical protein